MGLLDRYKTYEQRVHASAHFMLTGLATAFFVRFSVLGFAVALVLPFIIEYSQSRSDPKYDIMDGIFDLCEHVAGGLIIGAAFWLTN